MSTERTLSRREFVTGTAVAAATVLGTSRTARADIWRDDAGGWASDHITHVGDDTEELEKYQPRLISDAFDREKMIGMFGWYADSEDHDTRAYNYWLKYTHQDSLVDHIPLLGEALAADAHLGDHEPYTAFVDTDTGEVKEVLYTGYHHYAVHLDAEDANLSSEVLDEPTHTPLEIVSPHHHYRLGSEDAGTLASNTTDMESFLDVYDDWREDWLDADSTNLEAIKDPWKAREIGHWWAEGTWDHRLARIRVFLNWRDEHDDLTSW